jgi:hypothetical protein
MVQKYFTHILYITGAITMLPLLQYFAPELVLSLSGLQVGDAVGKLYAQQAGILIFCVGGLLVYAARHPMHRRPAVWAALIEKLGFCGLIILGWNHPALQGLHLVVFFDAICILLYGMYLWNSANKTP